MTTVALWRTVPRTFSYQGKLTGHDGIGIIDTLDMEFHIWDEAEDGILRWSEYHPDVPVVKGLFDVILGSHNPIGLPFDEQYYLEMFVDSELVSPRMPLNSTPYSFRSLYSDHARMADSVNIDFLPDTVLYAHTSGLALAVSWYNIFDMPDGFADGIDDSIDADHDTTNELIQDFWFDPLTDTLWLLEGDTLWGIYIPIQSDSLNNLADVAVESLQVGEMLIWAGSTWVSVDPGTLFIWNQDTTSQPGDIHIDGSLEAGDIVGQGAIDTTMVGPVPISSVGVNVSLASIDFDAYGPGSNIIFYFDALFDDNNGYLGANFVVEIVRNPGASEVIIAETEEFLFNGDFYKRKLVTITANDIPPVGMHTYEVRARCLAEPYTGGRCLRGKLILSEIKE